MKKLMPILFALIPLCAAAQSEVQGDTLKSRLPRRVQQGVPSLSGESAPGNRTAPLSATKELQGIGTGLPDSTTLHIVPPEYVEPLPWMQFRPRSMHNPFEMDYERYAAFLLSPEVILDAYSSYSTYPTMGSIMEAGTGVTYYSPDGHWELSGGVYAAKYSIPSRMHGAQTDVGVNASAGYRINSRMRIRAFGRYSGYGKSNSLHGYMNPMYPQSAYGMVMELKATDWLELHGGMERVYDPTKMKWTTVPLLYPVINIKKKK
ncbi:hypothetical protein [Bacteroides gallinarum]|uniref:hypothetical protein n=1 Tax=Bacteroides gallinarum TaxID=376806 RepID=UPI0003625CFD|nr:hypothetical protein [Bacteroides gallinarum]